MRVQPEGEMTPDTAAPSAAGEVFTPAALTHRVVLELVEAAAAKGVWLDCVIDPAVPASVRGDASGIVQALRALTGRALHATERGHIAVSLASESAGSSLSTLVFSVSDTAPSLTPEQRQGLAEPLAAHGHSGYEERPEGGNRVWFTAPVEALDEDQAPESAAARLERLTAWGRSRGGRILVVDDSATNRIITAALLRKAGFSVTLADGGVEAVRLMTDEAFDAVLMDVAMPEMDGLAATAAIRALPAPRAEVPIIAMTAHAFPEYRDRCLAAGMDDYIAKPFQTLDLLEALERQLA